MESVSPKKAWGRVVSQAMVLSIVPLALFPGDSSVDQGQWTDLAPR